jgi:glycosyltransferase involved in cell wall biosynthesis
MRVLLITPDVVGREMAGVGIRSYELARALEPHCDVTLAGLAPPGEPLEDIAVHYYELRNPRALRAAIAEADVIVAQPPWPTIAGWLRRSSARLIFDLYDPEPFEVLEFLAERRPLLRATVARLTLDRILEAMRVGNQFICASGKQRDLWVGAMLAAGLIEPAAYDRDPSMRSVIAEVPFGVDSEPPARGGPGPRERFAPQIAADDEIVLWNGGIWNWLDAATAVRAIGLLGERRPQAKLVFMGGSTITPARRATDEARGLADELGLLDSRVFFNDAWVPYAERASWLLAADCAISTHVEHLETRFAFRTRLLDCFWSGLPVVCTSGDELADLVDREQLGASVPQRDAEAAAGALAEVLERGKAAYAPALERVAARFEWPRVAAPLVEYVLTDEPPPRLGAGARRPPAQLARAAGFRAALATMNALGMRTWPRL